MPQIAVRVTDEILADAERITATRIDRPTRNSVLREAMRRGLNQMLGELR